MTRRLAVLALAFAVAAAWPAAAPAAKPRCAVKGSRTVAKNALVRVFVRRDRAGNRRLSACWRASGRKILVAAEYDDGYVESGAYRDVRLAGRFVALAYEATDISCKADCPPGYDGTVTEVNVRDVRSRRSRFVPADAAPGSLRLSRSGVAAWLVPVTGGAELRVLDGAGKGRLVDTGAIDAVALAGLRLDWTNAGAPKSAGLTPF